MKKTLSFLVASLIAACSFGQTNYDPRILILSPGNVKAERSFEKDIKGYDDEIKKDTRDRSLDPKELQQQPANIQRMMKSEVEYRKHMTFVKEISFRSEQYLSYRFYEKFTNLLILLKDTPSNGKMEDLKKLAESTQLQYVLSFPSVSFYKEDGISYARLAVQLYDHATGSLLIDTTFTGDWFNPGFEFACQDSSLTCTIHNSIAQALDKVIYNVAVNSPTLKREKELWRQRLDVLRHDQYARSFDKSFIENIIPAKDSNITMSSLYQLMVNDDKTKFVGFFLEKRGRQGFKQLSENKQDNNVRILNEKNIRDTGYLNDMPQTYAYIVKAVKYQGKWYYEKANVTYFEPHDKDEGHLEYFNNLQEWGFFKENSTTPDPDFWETHLFEKVKDLRKDPDWDKYGTTIWKTEEEENRNYIGMYKIVADQLKGKKSVQPTTITVN
ncbi:MAG TPA: hypothetical protein VHD83_13080 [Puia sp.]|nr:hypothetical protein [Puia sp.]